MKYAFAGTPEFAESILSALLVAGYKPECVLTQPDRPAGRGMKLRASSVKQRALQENILVLQPDRLKQNEEIQAYFQQAELDVLIVVAYGLIVPPSLLLLPRWGCWNVHASLLPRWRGAAPIHRAIEAGDSETGVAIMQMEAGLDTGPVYHTRSTPIVPEDTTATLQERLALLGAEALLQVIKWAESNTLPIPVIQQTEGMKYAEKVSSEEAKLDWHQSAEVLARQVRAYNPNPGAFAFYNDERLKIWEAEAVLNVPSDWMSVPAGTFVSIGNCPGVVCGQGTGLVLKVVQRAGAQRVSGERWWRQEIPSSFKGEG